jgi:type 1 glutamine amidotransferase
MRLDDSGKRGERAMRLLESKISRRLVITGTALSTMPVRAATKAQPRALALIGDRTHNPNYIRISLDKVFHELGIPIDYTIDYAGLSAASLKPYQILLILRDGVEWPNGYSGPDAFSSYETNLENASNFPAVTQVPWMTEEQGLAIKNFVSTGGGFYALHDSSHISLFNKNYRDVMGGAFWGHPPLRPFEVHATQNSHPITAGMHPFIVNDEQHYVDYDKDPRYVILEAENRDGLTFKDRGAKSSVGWAYDYGKGRVVFTAIGHTNHAMWNPQYFELQKRAVRWLLRDL